MRCPKCGGPTTVTHSYVIAKIYRTQRVVCEPCRTTYTNVSTLIEATPGKGAYALAEKLRNKELLSNQGE